MARPSLVIQTDAANSNERYPNTIVAAISKSSRNVPTHVHLHPTPENGLAVSCHVKCEQLTTVSKDRLGKRYGRISNLDMLAVDESLKSALNLR